MRRKRKKQMYIKSEWNSDDWRLKTKPFLLYSSHCYQCRVSSLVRSRLGFFSLLSSSFCHSLCVFLHYTLVFLSILVSFFFSFFLSPCAFKHNVQFGLCCDGIQHRLSLSLNDLTIRLLTCNTYTTREKKKNCSKRNRKTRSDTYIERERTLKDFIHTYRKTH